MEKKNKIIMEKKNKIFNEDIGPLFGLIDICPGRIPLHGISLTRFTLSES
jgi:hypothetical protein